MKQSAYQFVVLAKKLQEKYRKKRNLHQKVHLSPSKQRKIEEKIKWRKNRGIPQGQK